MKTFLPKNFGLKYFFAKYCNKAVKNYDFATQQYKRERERDIWEERGRRNFVIDKESTY